MTGAERRCRTRPNRADRAVSPPGGGPGRRIVEPSVATPCRRPKAATRRLDRDAAGVSSAIRLPRSVAYAGTSFNPTPHRRLRMRTPASTTDDDHAASFPLTALFERLRERSNSPVRVSVVWFGGPPALITALYVGRRWRYRVHRREPATSVVGGGQASPSSDTPATLPATSPTVHRQTPTQSHAIVTRTSEPTTAATATAPQPHRNRDCTPDAVATLLLGDRINEKGAGTAPVVPKRNESDWLSGRQSLSRSDGRPAARHRSARRVQRAHRSRAFLRLQAPAQALVPVQAPAQALVPVPAQRRRRREPS